MSKAMRDEYAADFYENSIFSFTSFNVMEKWVRALPEDLVTTLRLTWAVPKPAGFHSGCSDSEASEDDEADDDGDSQSKTECAGWWAVKALEEELGFRWIVVDWPWDHGGPASAAGWDWEGARERITPDGHFLWGDGDPDELLRVWREENEWFYSE
jgi:hypothetical protein